MNATTDNRTAADLEREGEEIRADLDRTLDEIQQRFSSGELLDRSVEFLRNTGSELLREAGETVRRNPVPVLLTAAGLLWLTSSVVSSRRHPEARGGARGGAGPRSSRSGAHSRGDYSSQGYSAQWSRGDDWDNSVHGRMRNAAHRVRSKVQQRMSSSMQAAQSHTYEARSHFSNLVQEQPIALGALALAAGALLGAALPMTRYENRWVGPVHHRAMARAKEVGERQYENLREAVASRGPGEARDSESGNGSQRSS